MTARKVIDCKRVDGGADCLVISGCSKCANAIYEPEATPLATTCGHVTCARREHLVSVLIKAALDSATELDDLRTAWAATYPNDEAVQEESERYQSTVERIHAACEALGVKVGISADEEVPA